MPDYTKYSQEQLVHILENKTDYKAEAIDAAMQEWENRGLKRKVGKALAEEIVRTKIRRFLSKKSRLLFNPRNMIFPESHFLSTNAVKKVFGQEYRRWKERKKMFGNSSQNADPGLF